MSKRYEELDSLRGLASLTVVIHHCLISFTTFYLLSNHQSINNNLMQTLSNSPLHFIWGGHEAVILFFVLSGFVLSLPILNGNFNRFDQYLIKRFCRIYLPYIFTIAVSALLYSIIGTNDTPDLSEWFNGMWSNPITLKSIISFLLMFGFDSHNLNTVTWSLVHEMRISIIFPLIMVIIIKYKFIKSLSYGMAATLSLWIIFLVISKTIPNQDISNLVFSFGTTFYYCSFFVIGAIFAKYRDKVSKLFFSLNFITKTIGALLALVLYTIEWSIPILGKAKNSNMEIAQKLGTITVDFSIAIAVIILFSYALNSKWFKNLLNQKPLLYLGKISYSLYLIHPIVLLIYVYFTKESFSVYFLIIVVPILSILLAGLMYKFIEKTSMNLGKSLTNNQDKRTIKRIA